MLHALYTVDMATGKVEIDSFNPATELAVPEGATHLSFSSALALVNLEDGSYKLSQSSAQNLSVTAAPADVVLQPATVPEGSGFMLLLLLIEFFQEVNGVQYPINNGSYNVLNLLDIAVIA